jgi:hypothetical protein
VLVFFFFFFFFFFHTGTPRKLEFNLDYGIILQIMTTIVSIWVAYLSRFRMLAISCYRNAYFESPYWFDLLICPFENASSSSSTAAAALAGLGKRANTTLNQLSLFFPKV